MATGRRSPSDIRHCLSDVLCYVDTGGKLATFGTEGALQTPGRTGLNVVDQHPIVRPLERGDMLQCGISGGTSASEL
jgi:hypothetical protein